MIKYNSVNKIYTLYRGTTNECGFENKSNVEFDECTIEYIHWLIKRYRMKYVVLEHDENMKPQITFIKHTGSNGKECSIKQSLMDVYFLLNDLEREERVEWAQVLDVSIDVLDDVYDFAITLILN